MGQLVFPQVPFEGWVIDADKHGLLDSLGDAVCLPAYNGEAVNIDGVPCGLAVLVDWKAVLPDSPVSSSLQSSWVHLNWHMTLLFSVMLSLSFGTTNMVQIVLLPLK